MPDPSFVIPLLLQSVLVPAAICAALLSLLARVRSDWSAPLAIAGGFIASMAATYHAQWSFPPHQALDWMPLVVLAALSAIAVERRGALPGRLLLSLLTAAIVAWPAMGSAGLVKTLVTVAVMALLMTLAWTVLAASSRRPAAPLALTLAAGGAGLALMIDASQLLGQLCGGLGVAIGACGLLRRPGGAGGFGPAAAGTGTLLLGALLGYAFIYAGFGMLMLLLLVAALLADAVLGALRRRPAAALPGALLTVLPVLVAVGLAVKAMQDSGGY